MDEKPDQIMNHIESQRSQLGRNLNELERRVKRTTDWRAQVDRNPMLMMGVALGGGLLLGTIVAGSRRSSSRTSWSTSSKDHGTSVNTPPSTSTSAASGTYSTALREQRRNASDTLDHIKAALIGFATAKVKEFMSEALPGFTQHYDEVERRSASYQQSSQYGSGGYQGTSRTEQQSGQTPYRQEPVSPSPGRTGF